MTQKMGWMILLTGTLMLSPSLAMAERRGEPPDQRLEGHLEELDLSASQAEEVNAALHAGRQEREALYAQKRSEIEKLHSLLERDEPDEATIMKQAEQIGSIKIRAHKSMLRTLLRVREQLSAEQRQKLMSMKRRDCAVDRPTEESRSER